MSKFLEETKDNFEDKEDDGASLLNDLEWAVMENKTKCNNASKTPIREAFQEWFDRTRWEIEQPNASFDQKDVADPRYKYCIQVDAEALRTLVPSAFRDALQDAAEKEDGEGDEDSVGYVNLIKRRWPDREFLPQHIRDELEAEEANDDYDYEDDDDEFSDTEGCTDGYVGFMRLDPRFLYPGSYLYLLGGSDWHCL